MTNKNLYDNGTSLKFISTIGEKLGQTLKSLNDIMFDVIEAKPYKLEWKKILDGYTKYKQRHGTVDIDSFSYDYVLGYSLLNNIAENKVMKEAMYLHIRAELIAKKSNGDID